MQKSGKTAVIVSLLIVTLLVMAFVFAKPTPRAVKACRDGIDNDGDGYTDYPNDPGCTSKNDKSELNTAIECDDGTDNDGDSAIDMADNGCSSPTDTDESNCGDSVCEGGEDCSTCAADCLDAGQVCCDGTAHTGDCCTNEDCTSPATCENHVCTIADSCSDNDGGWDIFTQGTTSGYLASSYYEHDDICLNSDTLEEFACSGNYNYSSIINCSANYTGCVNGACV